MSNEVPMDHKQLRKTLQLYLESIINNTDGIREACMKDFNGILDTYQELYPSTVWYYRGMLRFKAGMPVKY